nr:hypothetical protein [Kibdelosporangium sp. MJ126-NF4]CTQ95100.1 hypothetical protein [Kibdelosporangium sp. MJ126-NF4]
MDAVVDDAGLVGYPIVQPLFSVHTKKRAGVLESCFQYSRALVLWV